MSAHLRLAWRKLATQVDYEVTAPIENVVEVHVRLLDGPVGFIGYLHLYRPPSGVWFVNDINVDSDYRGEGIASGMLLAFHEKYPGEMVEHGDIVSDEGDAFAAKMVREYPSWNRIREGEWWMGGPE